ncbi:uncharacterized protein FTOL_13378 [Fusarium torulosum]|uniref:Uncharacterized protein n=1 Tax=Fusarium torulosum TaxID=33205 RepID=A0AAE8MNQ4_9HYPO|nr:uncharacterized protein FTOL_13378 [Fusarium torulosum]
MAASKCEEPRCFDCVIHVLCNELAQTSSNTLYES